MKKKWLMPKLEVLNVNKTLASTVFGSFTDEAYVPGQSVNENDSGTWNRFSS